MVVDGTAQDPAEIARAQIARGFDGLVSRNPAAALEAADAALATGRLVDDATFLKAVALEETGSVQDARALLDGLGKKAPQMWTRLGDSMRPYDKERTLACFDRAIEAYDRLGPKSEAHGMLYFKGLVLEELEREEEARECYRQLPILGVMPFTALFIIALAAAPVVQWLIGPPDGGAMAGVLVAIALLGAYVLRAGLGLEVKMVLKRLRS